MPYFDFHYMGGAKAMAPLIRAAVEFGIDTSDFANNNFLAGKFRVFVKEVISSKGVHPKYDKIRKLMPHYQLASNVFVTINMRIGQGYYVQTPVIASEELGNERVAAGFIKRVTGYIKEVLTALTPTNYIGQTVYALGDGYGNTLKNIIKLGMINKVRSFVNVDISELKIAKMKTMDYWNPLDFDTDCLKAIVTDINMCPIPAGAHVVASNSAHFLSRAKMQEIIIADNTFDGIYMASDMLFDLEKTTRLVASEFELTYKPDTGRVIGHIAGLTINERALVTSDFPTSYPLKFVYPIIGDDDYSHPYWRSFAMFSKTRFKDTSNMVHGKLGFPIKLANAGFKASLKRKRPFMRPMAQNDYDWLLDCGGYVSAKLNGLAAFAHADNNGVWKVTLRGGLTFLPTVDLDGDQPYIFSTDHSDQIYIELVCLFGKLYPFFLAEVGGQVADQKDKTTIINEKLTDFGIKLNSHQARSPMLSFKSYYPINCKGDVALNFIRVGQANKIVKLPMDGIIVNDLYGNVSFFYKPLATYDVLVQREDPGTTNLTTATGGPVTDPNGKFIGDGIYECAIHSGSHVIGCARPDKFRDSDPLHVDTSPLGFRMSYADGVYKVHMFNYSILVDGLTYSNFVRGIVTGPFEAVISMVMELGIEPTKLKYYHELVTGRLGFFDMDVNKQYYKTKDFVHVITEALPMLSPYYLWSAFYYARMIDSPPTKSSVASFNGKYHPAVSFLQGNYWHDYSWAYGAFSADLFDDRVAESITAPPDVASPVSPRADLRDENYPIYKFLSDNPMVTPDISLLRRLRRKKDHYDDFGPACP